MTTRFYFLFGSKIDQKPHAGTCIKATICYKVHSHNRSLFTTCCIYTFKVYTFSSNLPALASKLLNVFNQYTKRVFFPISTRNSFANC